MTWLLIGTLLGSIVSSSHDTREACEGRATLLREKGVVVLCVQQPPSYATICSNCAYYGASTTK